MVGPSRTSVGSSGRRIDARTALLLLFSLFIVYGTLLPFNFRFDPAMVEAKLRRSFGAFGRTASRADVVSNVLLFVPWGFLFAWRAAVRGRGLGRVTAGAALCGLALSAAVEVAQLFLPSRTTSPIDLATNTLGSALGALAGWPLARWAWPGWAPRLAGLVGRRPLAVCALAAGALIVVAGLAPFDVSIDLGSLKASLKSARPVPFGPALGGATPPADPWTWAREALTWALAGGLAVLALHESGTSGPRAIALAVALCGALSLAIEAAQLAIPARAADATSVVVALAGSLAGASAAAARPGWTARRWIDPALSALAVTLILSAWTPPVPAPPGRWPPKWSQLVPFWVYYRRTDIYALADLVEQVLAFVPLGGLLAARDARRAVRRSALIGLAFGLLLEAGQLFLADRTAEITDALSAAAGSALGAWLWSRGSTARNEARGTVRYRVR